MAKKVKDESIISQPTFFNVKDVHIARIKKLLDAGHGKVIIHGDGSMFAGNDAFLGSDYHKEFNSGVEDVNKNERVSRAKFRATYKVGDELPQSTQQIIDEFYLNNAKETQQMTTQSENKGFENTISI